MRVSKWLELSSHRESNLLFVESVREKKVLDFANSLSHLSPDFRSNPRFPEFNSRPEHQSWHDPG